MYDLLNINIKEKISDHMVEFICFNIDYTILNALRRILLSEIPSLAFDFVKFYKNSSYLNEDFLAHRVGLLPIEYTFSQIKEMNSTDECECSYLGCPKCKLFFRLKEKNEDNKNGIDIFCKDLKPLDSKSGIGLLKYKKNNNGIQLCHLNSQEEIHFEAIATKGVARNHSKWSSVCVCFYEEIKLDSNIYKFYIETNENVKVFDVFKLGLEQLNYQIIKLHLLFEKNIIVKDKEGYYFLKDYDDTVVNVLTKYLLTNNYKNIDCAFYKRSHFLDNDSSRLYVSSCKGEEKQEITCIKKGIQTIITLISFLENSFNQLYFQYEIKI